jgi:putative hydrolase of the HAD superfamily
MDIAIDWILFDADGVLQSMPSGWPRQLQDALGDDSDALLTEISEREYGTMSGGDFRAVLADIIGSHGLDADLDGVLDVWHQIAVDQQMITRIGELRAAGIGCVMATNQQNVRAAYMKSLADYAGVFEKQFYSTELGVAKPSPDYFTAIVNTLGVRAERALFIDDREDNVAGAQAAGLAAEVFAQHGGITELDRILAGYNLAVGKVSSPH